MWKEFVVITCFNSLVEENLVVICRYTTTIERRPPSLGGRVDPKEKYKTTSSEIENISVDLVNTLFSGWEFHGKRGTKASPYYIFPLI